MILLQVIYVDKLIVRSVIVNTEYENLVTSVHKKNSDVKNDPDVQEMNKLLAEGGIDQRLGVEAEEIQGEDLDAILWFFYTEDTFFLNPADERNSC